ncbi:unnamed protein product [Phytomonas sp. Hart1]|nr:unnamed protein product [Phytomonas sp. Hart1]|eukprot:CCW69187.1 unnamed protein product [Phytomonas sp. isolate Hart1]
MFCSSRVRFSGGHGDLFPNTKTAAHLSPSWVLSRPPPPAPRAGHCYVNFTHPEKHGKFQFITPEIHETKEVPIHAATGLRNCTTQRPSLRNCVAFLEGTKAALDWKNVKTNNTPMAQTNIQEKVDGERFVKTREFHPRDLKVPFRLGYEPSIDITECNDIIDKRTNALRKVEDQNRNGYMKEWIPFELNPPPKPAPPPPKK